MAVGGSEAGGDGLRHKVAQGSLLFLLFSLMTAVLFWRWIPDLTHSLIGPPEDNMNDFWNSWYATLAPQSAGFFKTVLIRFPEGTELYYHSFAYPQIFLVRILNYIFNSSRDITVLMTIHNITILLSFPLAALGSYYLIIYITKNVAAALAGGITFSFNPSHIEHVMHHANVASIEFIPFFVLATLIAARHGRPVWVIAACIFNALAALSCWYFLFYDGYFIIFHSLYLLISERRRPAFADLRVPAMILGGTALLLAPILAPMVKAALNNPAVYAEGSDLCVADLAAYLLFPPFHGLARFSLPFYARLTGNDWEDTVYLGPGNLLILFGLLWLRPAGSRSILPYILAGMALFCVIASGDSLHILGHRLFAMPGSLLSHLPFVRNVRTPSRAIVYVYLFLSIGVGYGIGHLWAERRTLRVRALAIMMMALLLVDIYPFRLDATSFDCGDGWQVIRDDPEQGFGVLDLPNLDPTSFASHVAGNFYMSRQVCHGRPILQGNVARDVTPSLRDRLEISDLARQQQMLETAKVKYIVITHPQGQAFTWRGEDMFKWPDGAAAQQDYRRLYHVVYDGPERLILRVYP